MYWTCGRRYDCAMGTTLLSALPGLPGIPLMLVGMVVAAWIGFAFGSVARLAGAFTMRGAFATAWLAG